MDIKSSLIIEDNNQGKINLILSGTFVRVYNQSFYLLTEALGRNLKADARYIKKAHNRLVVCGGFPKHIAMLDYPQAVKTQWGYQIRGKFDLSGYKSWLLPHEMSAQAVMNEGTTVAPSCSLRAQGGATNFSTKNIQNTTGLDITLSVQQAQYLSNWQKGLYPVESDLGFIESIKQTFLIQID